MATLLFHGTLLQNVIPITQDMGTEYMHLTLWFLVFVLFSALTVLNLLIGVLCEVVNVVSVIEKEKALVTCVQARLHTMLEDLGLDADGDQLISRIEFEELISKPEAAKALQGVGVDV